MLLYESDACLSYFADLFINKMEITKLLPDIAPNKNKFSVHLGVWATHLEDWATHQCINSDSGLGSVMDSRTTCEITYGPEKNLKPD